MSYKGKKVIRMIGVYYGKDKQSFIKLEYADHTVETINSDTTEKRKAPATAVI